MKNKETFIETNYLHKLFTMSSEQNNNSEEDFPLLEVPADLSENLYSITESKRSNNHSNKQRVIKSWPKITSIAASILMAVVLMQVYQQQQTLKQLERAQTDLATALHYLGQANKITQAQMYNSLNANMKNAVVAPVLEIGRDSVLPTVESIETATTIPNRSL